MHATDWPFLVIGACIFAAEIAMTIALRQATKEMRAMRKELPQMLGAFGGFSLLMEAYRTFKGDNFKGSGNGAKV